MSGALELDLSPVQDAIRELRGAGYEKAAAGILGRNLRTASNAVRRNVRGELKSHRKTGRMSSNVRVRVTSSPDLAGLSASVKSTGSGSNLIVGGVRPHSETSDGPMPLFVGRGRSSSVAGFARAVQHPGFAADPFFARGVDASEHDIHTALTAAQDEMASALARRLKRE